LRKDAGSRRFPHLELARAARRGAGSLILPLPLSFFPPHLRKAYFECRRAQLDMRTRIRGKRFQDTDKPGSSS
jgi:hypothetical protein